MTGTVQPQASVGHVSSSSICRKKLASVFRYNLADHEAMANTYPYVLAYLAERLEVHHFCSQGDEPHWLSSRGVEVHEIPMTIRRSSERDKWFKTFLWYMVAPWIGFRLRWMRVDLVYVEEPLPIFPLILMLTSGKPVAMSNADLFWDVYLGDGPLVSKIKKVLIAMDGAIWRRLRGTLTHTEAAKRFYVQKLGLDPGRIHVVPEACEPDLFRPVDRSKARHRFGFGDEIVIFHHGVLHPNKVLHRAVEYMAPLLKEFPQVRFVLTGEGSARPRIEESVEQYDVGTQVVFTGWLSDVDTLNNYLSACDVSLLIREGRFSDHFHLTANLLHSLACGTALLSARLDGICEYVEEGVSAMLFSPDDPVEFRDKLRRLIMEPELRERLRKGALLTAQDRLSPKAVTEQWIQVLLSFMEDN